MQIDQSMLQSIAALDDTALTAAIRAVATANGIDASALPTDAASLAAFRAAIRGASAGDLEKLKGVIEGLCRHE